jgi:hypothetical protein
MAPAFDALPEKETAPGGPETVSRSGERVTVVSAFHPRESKRPPRKSDLTPKWATGCSLRDTPTAKKWQEVSPSRLCHVPSSGRVLEQIERKEIKGRVIAGSAFIALTGTERAER